MKENKVRKGFDNTNIWGAVVVNAKLKSKELVKNDYTQVIEVTAGKKTYRLLNCYARPDFRGRVWE